MLKAREMINAHLFPVLGVVATVSFVSVAMSLRLIAEKAARWNTCFVTRLSGMRQTNLAGRCRTRKSLRLSSATGEALLGLAGGSKEPVDLGELSAFPSKRSHPLRRGDVASLRSTNQQRDIQSYPLSLMAWCVSCS